jgi:1A family penicillin-binding protein
LEPPRGRFERDEVRSLTAGGALLKALIADLAALLTWALAAARSSDARATTAATRRRRRSALWRVLLGLIKTFLFVAALGSLATTGVLLWALHDLPAEKPFGGESSLILEAANGETLGRAGPLKLADAARTDFPDDLVNAVIGIEDRRFYSHPGFDPEGILRALQRNLAAGTIVEGGSTITQQLVKMRILGRERAFSHKLREAVAAMWLDVQLSKDEILTRYLNSVYLGAGAYGMPAAARMYFDKRPGELTLPEAAMLAGLIRSPSRNNPLQNLQQAQARAAVVIEAMRDTGKIDAKTATDAIAHPAVLHPSRRIQLANTWFADWIAREAPAVLGSGSMRLRTTLNPGLQKLAEQAIAAVLDKEGARRRVSEAALVAMRPEGAVVAMVGGRDYQASQFNRAVDAWRQPGSSFKLFVYLAALRKGYSINDTVDASPIDIKNWHPENYGNAHYGRVTLAEAFAKSINTAAARLGQQVGLKEVIAAARDLGLSGTLPAVPSLPLGTAEVSLLELTAAYAAVNAGKMPIKPWGIAGFGVEGQPRLQSMGAPIGGTQPLQPYQKPVIELMQNVLQHGTGRAAALDGFAAGKTGTSQNYRDAWFIGFNDAFVVGVWVGNDDRAPMDRVTGGSLPAAIWKRFMTEAPGVMNRDTQQPTASEALVGAGTTPGQAPAVQSEAPACDVEACARTYQSFRASDCTYQPFGSSTRRVCEKAPRLATPVAPSVFAESSPDKAARSTTGQAPAAQSEAPACDVEACARTHQSFRASDCTYQPFGSSTRRMCEKFPRLATPAARSAFAQSSPDKPDRPQCNVAVCSGFYESFNPGDCTYQPYGSGPRLLCTR